MEYHEFIDKMDLKPNVTLSWEQFEKVLHMAYLAHTHEPLVNHLPVRGTIVTGTLSNKPKKITLNDVEVFEPEFKEPKPDIQKIEVVSPGDTKFTQNTMTRDGRATILSQKNILLIMEDVDGAITRKHLFKLAEAKFSRLSLDFNGFYRQVKRLEKMGFLKPDKHKVSLVGIPASHVVTPVFDMSQDASKPDPKPVRVFGCITDLQRVDFAHELGYSTIAEAVRELGSWKFEQKLKDHYKTKG